MAASAAEASIQAYATESKRSIGCASSVRRSSFASHDHEAKGRMPTHRRTVSYETSRPRCEQIFDIAIAECESNIQPNRVPDDLRGKLVAGNA